MIERLEAERDELKKCILPQWLYKEIHTCIDNDLADALKRTEELADKMAFSSDNPACVLFQKSLAAYKKLQDRRHIYRTIISALDGLKPQSKGEEATT